MESCLIIIFSPAGMWYHVNYLAFYVSLPDELGHPFPCYVIFNVSVGSQFVGELTAYHMLIN